MTKVHTTDLKVFEVSNKDIYFSLKENRVISLKELLTALKSINKEMVKEIIEREG